jgi:hypothetical protein
MTLMQIGYLPSVPMTVPFGMTLEEYNHYLSWRIEVQMIATFLHDWKIAKEEDKSKCLDPIKQALDRANQRAMMFPPVLLPVDIVNPNASASDPLAQDATSAHLSLHTMIQELASLFENAQLAAGTPRETE